MTVPDAENSHVAPVGGRRAEPHRRGRAAGVGHLGGDGALPDQLVERELVTAQLARRPVPACGTRSPAGRIASCASWAFLTLPRRRRGRSGTYSGAVQLARLAAGRGDGLVRQRRRVGPHVGDVAVLVQPLRDAHRLPGGEPQLAARLLLQGRRRERRGGPAGVRLLLDARGRANAARSKRLGERGRGRLVEMDDAAAACGRGQYPAVVEVPAGRDPSRRRRPPAGR